MKDRIIEYIQNPDALEKLYREDPSSFSKALYSIPKDSIGSSYEFWIARLRYDSHFSIEITKPGNNISILVVILLAVIAGTIAKIPDIFKIEEDFFYPRFIGFALFPVLSAYFILKSKISNKVLSAVSAIFAISALYMIFIPDLKDSDSLILSFIHFPFFMWTVTGVAFLAGYLKDVNRRIEYVMFNGELAIYTAILLISGMILTGMTAGLFSVIKVDIMETYMRWIVIYGVAACPIVGAHLVTIRIKGNSRISPLIARIFAPLFLLTLVVYLLVIIVQGKSPFTDRDFLIAFNLMLMLVLAIGIFSITEKGIEQGQKWLDLVIMALLIVGMIVDIVALSAILFRLSSYGFTPNRIAVLGSNLIVCVNAGGLVYFYGKYLLRKGNIEDARKWIAVYLPVYSIWTAFIVFVFPIIYRFQ